jgi:hypothetical protein
MRINLAKRQLSIGIEADATCVSIPAFIISVRYRNTLVPDRVYLFRYRTCSGSSILFNPLPD